jgi:hypothetical protein
MTTCPLSRVSVAMSPGQLRGTAGRHRRSAVDLSSPSATAYCSRSQLSADTEMLPRALGPGARLGDSSACLFPPPDRDTTETERPP